MTRVAINGAEPVGRAAALEALHGSKDYSAGRSDKCNIGNVNAEQAYHEKANASDKTEREDAA